MTQNPNPQEALATIQAARNGVAPSTNYPIAYDLFHGVVCGMLVAGQGMPRPWSFIFLIVSLCGLAAMVGWWRRKYGWWVSGYSPKRARWVAFGLLAVFQCLIGLTLYGRFVGPSWLFILSGALGFVAAIAGGRLWLHIWRKELAEGV